MRRKNFLPVAAAAGVLAFVAPGAAFAQSWAPGAELYNQQVQVASTNGDVNTLTFGQDGSLQIVSSNGASAQGQWMVQGNQLCVMVGSARECWGYRTPFQASRAVSMTSDCGATTQWTALGTNQPPVQNRAGERG